MGEMYRTNSWDEDIKSLMKQFKLGDRSREIIAEVKATAKGNESDDILYERAWRRFKAILVAS